MAFSLCFKLPGKSIKVTIFHPSFHYAGHTNILFWMFNFLIINDSSKSIQILLYVFEIDTILVKVLLILGCDIIFLSKFLMPLFEYFKIYFFSHCLIIDQYFNIAKSTIWHVNILKLVNTTMNSSYLKNLLKKWILNALLRGTLLLYTLSKSFNLFFKSLRILIAHGILHFNAFHITLFLFPFRVHIIHFLLKFFGYLLCFKQLFKSLLILFYLSSYFVIILFIWFYYWPSKCFVIISIQNSINFPLILPINQRFYRVQFYKLIKIWFLLQHY